MFTFTFSATNSTLAGQPGEKRASFTNPGVSTRDRRSPPVAQSIVRGSDWAAFSAAAAPEYGL
ncbi:hypothetical protein Ade02nite_02500 [Paractinoplanes deccanensis]|uniref:DUF397 domain-containing protein n=1 Tax=Paractinoplanes deccanensis TaxID=113561 RepID=A0ABQ3XV40_9ACTN|nr:hypothetical protein Ade02nite_02500 [Actinoplanes deccanensis]